jgi:eukaryotic-like serine/threonine-protein kinase
VTDVQPNRWRQISRLFALASQCMNGADREALLDEVCRDDADLRRELESLLVHDADEADRTAVLTPPIMPVVGTALGIYDIQALIEAGGMAQVFRARDTRLHRDVALKILPAAVAADDDRRTRFEREAQALAALNHPNIAQIYGIEERGAILALVLELVDGLTLADRIVRGPLQVDEALAIARQIMDALIAAHDHGIVHRDLKPANIKIRPDGTVKVLDFGLAKALTAERPAASPSRRLTARGVILGTVAYMSPEQVRGEDGDARVDMWAFGVTMYETVTGRTPFAGATLAEIVGSVLHQEPDWKPVPARMRALLQRCLDKDPNQRLRHMADARLWLEAPSAYQRSKNRFVPWVAAAAVAAALVVAAGAVSSVRDRAPTPSPMRFDIPPPADSTFAGYFAVSPDGRHVAFRATDPRGSRSIWLHAFESGQSRPLQRTGDLSTSSIFWSADSKFIGFVSADGHLKKVGIDGQPALPITALPLGWGGAAWNADDVLVVGQRAGGLARVSANGGTLQPLTALDPSRQELGHGGPRFLPDGRHIIYSRASMVPANNALYVGSIDLAPSEQPSQPLLATPSRPAVVASSDPRYSYVLFVRDNVLLACLFDTQRLTLASEPVRIADDVGEIPNGPIAIASVSASTNGVLAYRNAESTSGWAAWMDRDGHEHGVLASDPLDAPAQPRISPDGRRVAMVVASNIWVYHTDGKPPIKLTLDGRASAPIWSADGRHIIYRDDSKEELRVIPADRLGAAESTLPTGKLFPQEWTADGTVIAAMMRDIPPTMDRRLPAESGAPGTSDVDIVRFKATRTATIEPLVRTPAQDGAGGVALSPDGRWLAYTSTVTGREEIWVQPVSGAAAPIRVSADGGVVPRWAPGSRFLYYLAQSRLLSVPVKNGREGLGFGAPTLIFDNQSGPLSYDVAPDGKILLIVYGPFIGRKPIKIVLNWTALLPTAARR